MNYETKREILEKKGYTPLDFHPMLDPERYMINREGEVILVKIEGHIFKKLLPRVHKKLNDSYYMLTALNGITSRCYIKDLLRDQKEYNAEIGRAW